MTTLVVDASLVVALLVDDGPDGSWAEQMVAQQHLVAPHLLPAEVTNALRRTVAKGLLAPEVASLALADLDDLGLELYPFAPLADRVWELRDSITAYDGWYVALAERLGTSLATLDVRLARAPGVRCPVVVTEGGD